MIVREGLLAYIAILGGGYLLLSPIGPVGCWIARMVG